jgi:hypothetical protein
MTAPLVRGRFSARNATRSAELFTSFVGMRITRFDDLLRACII